MWFLIYDKVFKYLILVFDHVIYKIKNIGFSLFCEIKKRVCHVRII